MEQESPAVARRFTLGMWRDTRVAACRGYPCVG